MKKIKKRLFAVSFVIIVLYNFLIISVSADTDTDSGSSSSSASDYALFSTDWTHSVLKNQYYKFLNMTDDDFYKNHLQNFNFDRTFYAIDYYYNKISKLPDTPWSPHICELTDELNYGTLSKAEAGAKYKQAVLDRELLLALDDTMLENLGVNGVRYSSLEELGITSNNTFSESGISVTFHDQVCAFLGKHSSDSPIYSFYDFTSAYTNTSEISVYTGGAMPPAFYVPHNCVVYQSGRALNSDTFYVILGTNELFGIPESTHYNNYLGFGWYNSGDSVNTAALNLGHASTLTNGAIASYANAVYIWSNGTKESSTIFRQTNTNGRAWTYISLLNNLPGFMVSIDDTPSNPDLPDTFLPEEIPYDDDDYVSVLIPVDNNYNVTEGDIIYLSPEDYTNYVNNGTIVEGDYVNTYNDDTTNNIVNNYNNSVNNYNNNTYSFDDRRIVSSLSDINHTLIAIKRAIQMLSRDTQEVFTDQPVYNDFSECYMNIPLLASIYATVDGMKTSQSDNGLDNLQMGTSTNQSLNRAVSGFSIDMSWYSPYRENIREMLRIGIWGWGIVLLWRKLCIVPNGQNQSEVSS